MDLVEQHGRDPGKLGIGLERAKNTPWVMAMTRVALPTLLSSRVA